LLKVALNTKIRKKVVIFCFKGTAKTEEMIKLLDATVLEIINPLWQGSSATGKLYHLRLRVECTLFCDLQSWARTHAVLVIGLYELLGNPTT
jgi:hypothetical protein